MDGSWASSGEGCVEIVRPFATFFDSLNPPSGIYYSTIEEVFMADAPRITVEELKKRMDAGEDFTVD